MGILGRKEIAELSMSLTTALLLICTPPALAQTGSPVETDLPMENFFGDKKNVKPKKEKEKKQEVSEPSAPLPVPEPELPPDPMEESIESEKDLYAPMPTPKIDPAKPIQTRPEDPLAPEDPFDQDVATELPDDDVEPVMQGENDEQQVGEDFIPFDEDPDIMFGGPESEDELPSASPPSQPGDSQRDEAISGLPDESESPLAFEDEVLDQPESSEDLYADSTRVRRGETKIRHPLAEKGLIRITKDKTYVYRVPRTLQDRAISMRAGLYDPSQLQNPETGATFSETYEQTQGPIAMFEYEWQWLRGSLGKLGFKVGTGVFTTQGNGQFKDSVPSNGDRTTPLEQFTFLALPNSVSAVFRFQFSDTQMFIPYIDGGIMGIVFFELRDDQDLPKTGLAPAAFASGGMAFNLAAIDNLAILGLDREYGINNIYFLAEVRQILNVGSDYDFTATAFNGGFLFEF